MTSVVCVPSSAAETDLARDIRRLAMEQWGTRNPTVLVGRHLRLREALVKVRQVAMSDAPVLLTGETGTGKELFARALYLLGRRRGKPFLSVNCAQYQDGPLVASELFGHKKGSFTGAIADHRGVFEEADGGVVFLDEVGELTRATQAMLLRALGDGEIVPVGGTRAQPVNVRVVTATSRDLRAMVADGRFRADLYYRLRYLHIHVPAVRERGEDWELIADYHLTRLNSERVDRKRFSDDALRTLSNYDWPGNVRELKSVVDMGFHLSTGDLIEARTFAEELEAVARDEQLGRVPIVAPATDLFERLESGETNFWEAVHRPYMERELSRAQVRDLVARGLSRTRGSYKRLLSVFGIPPEEYLKFMDFLRHQRLKPED
jgi:transcriptional regulator with GAF, ATPase, and Fis domain